MAQDPFLSPLTELDLCHELRTDPVREPRDDPRRRGFER